MNSKNKGSRALLRGGSRAHTALSGSTSRTIYPVAIIFFLALFITISTYLTYPRADAFAKSRADATSQADITAVRWIEADSAGKNYVVLSNQAVAAAALQEFGFKKYYTDQNTECQMSKVKCQMLFFYPIPTTSLLYQLYLDILSHLASELASIRTTHASPALIENLPIKAYETTMRLNELAAISAPEPNLLMVEPWDQTVIESIVKALQDSELHLNPVVTGNSIKVPLPTLTEEKRQELTRLVSQKCEEAKIAIRNIRHEKISASDDLCDDGKVSEDDHERFKKELQKLVDEYNQKIEELRKSKIQELTTL